MDISKEQRKKYKKVFTQFDSNGDGTLTHSDFRVALDNIGYCLTDGDLERFIDQVDANDDGKITFEEFVTAIHRPPPKQQNMAKLRRMFRLMDADKSGYITLKDLKALNESSGDEMSVEQMKEIIQKMDLDGDKKVSFEEFSKHMATQ